jgi:hypothetical protein
MARGAVGVLRILVMLRAGRLNRTNIVSYAVAGQAKLVDGAEPQEPRVGRPVRRMTRDTAFSLQRRVFESERSLLVCVTLNASSISTDSQSGLFEFESAMWIVAVAALHYSFKHLVMEGFVEVGFNFTVTAYAKLWVAHLQQLGRREALFLRIGFAN